MFFSLNIIITTTIITRIKSFYHILLGEFYRSVFLFQWMRVAWWNHESAREQADAHPQEGSFVCIFTPFYFSIFLYFHPLYNHSSYQNVLVSMRLSENFSSSSTIAWVTFDRFWVLESRCTNCVSKETFSFISPMHFNHMWIWVSRSWMPEVQTVVRNRLCSFYTEYRGYDNGAVTPSSSKYSFVERFGERVNWNFRLRLTLSTLYRTYR